MSSSIMLAKKFDIKHVKFPCVMLEKLDGVACRFDRAGDSVTAISRQNKPVPAAEFICRELDHVLAPGEHIVGELYMRDKSFKDISGAARRQEPQEDLQLYIYDCWFDDSARSGLGYNDRMKRLAANLQVASESFTFSKVKIIPVQYICHSTDMIREFTEAFSTVRPEAEGLVLRTLDAPYEVNKRSWGMQKIKFRETVDLRVLAVHEAISKDGEPLGMIGRITCEYKGSEIGVGPGSLTHRERADFFNNQDQFVNHIIEVEYMPDAEYTALREPRFKRMRDDKDSPNEE